MKLAQLLSAQAIGAEGQGFDSQAGQIGTLSVANSSPRLRRFFGAVSPNAHAPSRGDGPVTCYTLRRNTASMMKIRL